MQEQSYKNHVRWHPLFHFVAMPLAFVNFLISIAYVIHRFSWLAVILVISSLALLLVLPIVRRYATKLQDRIVRNEENLRHFVLTGALLDARLSATQITGLRFASDHEFPALCQRAADENLNADQIKQAVTLWRVDRLRV